MSEIKTMEQKKAEFLATAKRNKENFELHKILIQKHHLNAQEVNVSDNDLMFLKLVSYAEEYAESKVSQFPSPQEVTDEEGGLKPCPFCGSKELALTSHPSKDGTVIFYTIHHLAHTPCGIELMTTNRENLITQWNLRSSPTNNQNLTP